MSQVIFANNASATVAENVNANTSQINIRLSEATMFPRMEYGSSHYYCTLEDAQKSKLEIIKVTSAKEEYAFIGEDDPVLVLALGVVKGQEGTASQSWPVGSKIELRLTNQGLVDIQDQVFSAATEQVTTATPQITLSGDVDAGPYNYNVLEGIDIPVTVNQTAKLKTPRNIQINLGSTSPSSFDGTADVTPGVLGILSTANGGTGTNTGTTPFASKLASARTFLTNLASTQTGSFDGSANVVSGVTGILPIEQGGTGNDSGTVNNATKLATARAIVTNLATTTPISFDGTADVQTSVTGVLPISNGGTNATTAAQALTNLGITSSTTDLVAGTSTLATGAIYLVYE